MDKGVLSAITTIAGTGVGALVGGPAGAAIGAGLGSQIPNLFPGSEAVPELPPMVDPAQQSMLDELYARRRSIEMGTSSEFATGREIIQRAEATALSNVQKLTGGDVGAAVTAAGQVMEGAGDNVSKMVGSATQMTAPYTQMIGELVDRMSQRRLELGMADRLQSMATETQRQENRNQLLSQVIASPTVLNAAGQGLQGVVTKGNEFINGIPKFLAGDNLGMMGGEVVGLSSGFASAADEALYNKDYTLFMESKGY
jgi:hypothetical protein